jgi:DNA polymerase-1
MERPVLLLDVFSLFYRAYYALPPMHTRRGEPTSALYGFSALVLKLLREQAPRGAAFALDAPHPTFRHEAYAEYKAQRAVAPGSLTAQMFRLVHLMDAFGFPAFAVPGVEADDILATLAREIQGGGDPVLVVTGDRDALQLVRPGVRVLLVSRGASEARAYDDAAVLERFGVPASALPSYFALVGDASDNLPGVPGFGPKRAASLLRDFGTLDAALDHLDLVSPPALRASLSAHATRARLWEELARLRDDVPLRHGPRFGSVPLESEARLRALFEALEFASLLPRLRPALEPRAA